MSGSSLFQTEMSVRLGDINSGHHLKMTSLLEMCQHVRILFLKKSGSTEQNSKNISVILRHVDCHIASQSYFEDNLRFNLHLRGSDRYTLDLFYVVHNNSTNKKVAHVNENIVFFNYELNKITQIPIYLRESIINLNNS
tara:strand:+ start:2113 stop:2529 length:417 start_codon:yes stop_codon:yes gene_type:complete